MFIFTNAMKYCKIITASEYEFSSRNASIYYNDITVKRKDETMYQ